MFTPIYRKSRAAFFKANLSLKPVQKSLVYCPVQYCGKSRASFFKPKFSSNPEHKTLVYCKK